MESNSALNILDYIVIGTILLSGLLALMRGLVKEILSLLTWIGAFWVAGKYYHLAEPTVQHYISHKSAVGLGAGVLVFVLAFIIFSLLGFLISSLVRGKALTAIDRSLGFVFGILRGGLVVSILYLAVASIIYPELLKDTSKPSTDLLDRPKIATAQDEKNKDDKKPTTPDWLMKARTRPALVWGAQMLQDILPQDKINKTTKSVLSHKQDLQNAVDDQAEEMLTIPGVTRTPSRTVDPETREQINNAINGKPAQ